MTKKNLFNHGLAMAAAFVAGCSPPPTVAPADPPPYVTTLSMKQMMEWVVDPAADAIWESVAIVITEKGEKLKAPETDLEWAVVRNGAASLIESSNLLMTPIRVRDGAQWVLAAKRMAAAAAVVLAATEKKDVQALFDAGALVYNACSACHVRYRPGEVPPEVVSPTK
jgi:hypothetical protein